MPPVRCRAVVTCRARRIRCRRRRWAISSRLSTPPTLHEQTPVDRLVRHVQLRLGRKGLSEPPRDLLRRPVLGEFRRHQRAQGHRAREPTRLRPTGTRPHARVSATAARWCRRPPWRRTSRLTVEGVRPRRRPICRSDSPRASPREISSRSGTRNARRDRVRRGGGISPRAATTE